MLNWYRLCRHRLRLLWHLSWPDRVLLVEVLAALGLARLCVLAVPFRYLAPRLGQRLWSGAGNGDIRRTTARRLGRAIHTAARVTPWRSQCLEQAIAGQLLLSYRGLPSTLYLGVVKDGTTIEAHAWLRCGEHCVTGGQNVQRYTVVARFGEPGG